jgi:hypothetical protein
VSSTRKDFPWTNSHHIGGDLRAGVQRLKDATPKRVLLGSGKLAAELDPLELTRRSPTWRARFAATSRVTTKTPNRSAGPTTTRRTESLLIQLLQATSRCIAVAGIAASATKVISAALWRDQRSLRAPVDGRRR